MFGVKIKQTGDNYTIIVERFGYTHIHAHASEHSFQRIMQLLKTAVYRVSSNSGYVYYVGSL